MIEIYFSGESYHYVKRKVKQVFDDYNLKWDSEKWVSSDGKSKIIGIFEGHKRPTTLYAINLPETFVDKIKTQLKAYPEYIQIITIKEVKDPSEGKQEKIEKQPICDPNLLALIFANSKNNNLRSLRLYISFGLYLMEPSKVEGFLDDCVKEGQLVRISGTFELCR